MRKVAVTFALLLVVASAGWAHAVPITTPDLVITVGDKTFFNFTCSTNSTLFTCAGIDVAPYISTSPPDPIAGLFGLNITGALTALAGTSADVQISYEATSSGGQFISGATLFFNGNVVTNVLENIFDFATQALLAQLFVQNPPPQLTDAEAFIFPTTHIFVQKDIGLIGTTSQAAISIVHQNFTQTVPEPSSLLLLGSALVGMGLCARRKIRK